MRSPIIFVLHKVAALFLVLVIGMTSFTTPAFAEPFPIELAKEATKVAVETGVAFLVPPAICLAADAIATGFFPPAAALAPYCTSFAIPAGAAGAVTTGTIKVTHQALAY